MLRKKNEQTKCPLSNECSIQIPSFTQQMQLSIFILAILLMLRSYSIRNLTMTISVHYSTSEDLNMFQLHNNRSRHNGHSIARTKEEIKSLRIENI